MGYYWKSVIMINDSNCGYNKYPVFEAVMKWLNYWRANIAFTDNCGPEFIVVSGKNWPNHSIDAFAKDGNSLVEMLGEIGKPGPASIQIMQKGEDYDLDQKRWNLLIIELTGKGWKITKDFDRDE